MCVYIPRVFQSLTRGFGPPASFSIFSATTVLLAESPHLRLRREISLRPRNSTYDRKKKKHMGAIGSEREK